MASPVKSEGIGLPLIEEEQKRTGDLEGGQVVVHMTKESTQTWDMLSREEKANMTLSTGFGLGIFSAIPTAGFGALTWAVVKLEADTDPEEFSIVTTVAALATSIFATYFLVAIGCCCYGAVQKFR